MKEYLKYVLFNVLGMLGMGGATRYGVLRSQGEAQRGNNVFTQSLFLALGIGVCFLVLGIVGAERITLLLGAEAEITPMCKTYLQVMLLFAPVFMLDYIFIFSLGMGILGAVLATGIAPVIGMLIMSWHWVKKRNGFHLTRIRKESSHVYRIMITGAPSLVTEVSLGVVMLIYNLILLKLGGNIAIAAYGVVANLSLVVTAIYTGIAQGVQPLASRYYGESRRERLGKLYQYGNWTILLLWAIIFGGMYIGAGTVTAVFNSEGNVELQTVAVEGIRLYFMGCGFAGYNIVLSIYFAAIDRAREANILSVLRGFLLIVPMTVLMAGLWGMKGLWLAVPVTEGMVTVLGIWMMKKGQVRRMHR